LAEQSAECPATLAPLDSSAAERGALRHDHPARLRDARRTLLRHALRTMLLRDAVLMALRPVRRGRRQGRALGRADGGCLMRSRFAPGWLSRGGTL